MNILKKVMLISHFIEAKVNNLKIIHFQTKICNFNTTLKNRPRN